MKIFDPSMAAYQISSLTNWNIQVWQFKYPNTKQLYLFEAFLWMHLSCSPKITHGLYNCYCLGSSELMALQKSCFRLDWGSLDSFLWLPMAMLTFAKKSCPPPLPNQKTIIFQKVPLLRIFDGFGGQSFPPPIMLAWSYLRQISSIIWHNRVFPSDPEWSVPCQRWHHCSWVYRCISLWNQILPIYITVPIFVCSDWPLVHPHLGWRAWHKP
jgi:hypothetical protein